jgi:hypothetical protein
MSQPSSWLAVLWGGCALALTLRPNRLGRCPTPAPARIIYVCGKVRDRVLNPPCYLSPWPIFQKKTRRATAGLFDVRYLNLHSVSGMKRRYSPGTKSSSGVKTTRSRMKPSSRTHRLSMGRRGCRRRRWPAGRFPPARCARPTRRAGSPRWRRRRLAAARPARRRPSHRRRWARGRAARR